MPKWKEPRLLPGARQPKLVSLDGGLCVTFVNTASEKRRRLETYAELLEWGQVNGVLAADDVERLSRQAGERPTNAEAVVAEAEKVRSSIERILLALAERRQPAAADLEELNAALAALPHQCLTRDADDYRWSWSDRGGDDLDRVLWPVVFSAADVLTSKSRFKVRQCDGEDCDLLFVDHTPGSPRRWCSQKSCGSRASSRRHYQRRLRPLNQWIKDGIEAERRGRAKPKREAYFQVKSPRRGKV